MNKDDKLEILHGDMARWLQRRGGVVPDKRLSGVQRKQIRDCFDVIDTDGSGALDVDELLEAFELIGAKPRRSEVTQLVRELNKGEDEMDLNVFEMLMARAYGNKTEEDNILTSGTSMSFLDISRTLQRKRLLQSLSDFEARQSIISDAPRLLSGIEMLREEDEVGKGTAKKPVKDFADKKHQLLIAWSRCAKSNGGEKARVETARDAPSDRSVAEWKSKIPPRSYVVIANTALHRQLSSLDGRVNPVRGRRSVDGPSTVGSSTFEGSQARSYSHSDLTSLGEDDGLFSGGANSRNRVARLLTQRMRSYSRVSIQHSGSETTLPALNELPAESDCVLMVANRLPVSLTKSPKGEWIFKESAGGLISGLTGVQSYQSKWIGWPGVFVEEGRERDKLTKMLIAKNFIPVWLSQEIIRDFYNGYCNNILWPLFHYVPLSVETWHSLAGTTSMENDWLAYKKANKIFADHVMQHHDSDDLTVWIHDYHLMLLPGLLKERNPKMKIGWFLHTPFPSSEIYRTLPWGHHVLSAVLQADLLGFHTYDYARHFMSSSCRMLGVEGTTVGIEFQGHITRLITCPIGINIDRFRQKVEDNEVKAKNDALKRKFGHRKVLLGVDRLDMIKGIPQKLLAFEKFLMERPGWRSKVIFVQVAVPTRTDVLEYKKLRSMVNEMVGRINGAFGSVTEMPIHFLNQSLGLDDLVALYKATDVALVTSLRDGMNLVSFEYVACQQNKPIPGGLILSEFAGAAQSLGAGSILVNPWNTTELAQAIYDALNMNAEERIERHKVNYDHISNHTAQNWAETFITELNDTQIEAGIRNGQTPPNLPVEEMVQAYHSSMPRLIVLGYNATLTPRTETSRPQRRQYDAMKHSVRVNKKTLNSVTELAEAEGNVVMIFSGSDCEKIEEMFGDLPVWLIAENGMYIKAPHTEKRCSSKWTPVLDRISTGWMDAVRVVFDYFCERTPRSFVEERKTSLVWNFKYADIEFGRLQANDLMQHLRSGPNAHMPVDIIPGARSVEARPKGLTKGLMMQHIVGYMERCLGIVDICFEFVVCIGHFMAKDESIFEYFEGKNLLDKSDALERSASVGHCRYSRTTEEATTPRSQGSSQDDASQDNYEYRPPVVNPKFLFTCTVGRNESLAKYSLPSSEEVAAVLDTLVETVTDISKYEAYRSQFFLPQESP